MTSLLSFSWRKAQESNQRLQRRSGHNPSGLRSDPWALGITTSTSTAESLAVQSSNDETLVSLSSILRQSPPTPEGLRPRKSIHTIRSKLLSTQSIGSVAQQQEAELAIRDHPPNPPSYLQSSFSYGPTRLPPILQYTRRSPQISPRPLHSQISGYAGGGGGGDFNAEGEIADIVNTYNYDYDVSSSHGSPGRSQRRRNRQIAESPDLQRGKAKTAVGALLVAMSEHERNKVDSIEVMHVPGRLSTHEPSQHSILPPRAWMDDEDEDDTIGDDTIDDDYQSSLHMSPSSNPWRHPSATSWSERQRQFQLDTSFTKGFLSQDPNCSWMHNPVAGDLPYNFDSIVPEGIESKEQHAAPDSMGRPPMMNVNQTEENGLNVSAISHSHHVRDMESLYSLADTMEDEDDDDLRENGNEIPKYYQALSDEVSVKDDDEMDNSLLFIKVQNQRRAKEDLILSTCERLQDELDLMIDVMDEINSGNDAPDQNRFLLGLDQGTRSTLCQHLELFLNQQHGTMVSDLKAAEEGSAEMRRRALLFCLSLLQLGSQRDGVALTQGPTTKKPPSYSSTLVNHRWKCIAGFRGSLGLEDDLKSPPTQRGGDTSLFSLPSDSVNDNTPHTSNVSMTTTITTVVSPDRNSRHKMHQQAEWAAFDSSEHIENSQSQRQTMEKLASLLARMESAAMRLLYRTKSQKGPDGEHSAIEEIEQVYHEMIKLSPVDLKRIVSSFELILEEEPFSYMTRVVSEDVECQMVAAASVNERDLPSEEIPAFDPKQSSDANTSYDNNENHHILSHPNKASHELARTNIIDQEEEKLNKRDSDRQSLTVVDLNGQSDPRSSSTRERAEEEPQSDGGEQPIDDLRRTVGSFDLESVQEEREGTPSWDDDERVEVVATVNDTVPIRRMRGITQPNDSRFRKGRFWKRRFLAPIHGRHASAE